MLKSTFIISDMDCPAEEQLIRMKLAGMEKISLLDFDLPHRRLTIYHTNDIQEIRHSLRSLKLGEQLEQSVPGSLPHAAPDPALQRPVLIWVLLINAAFFIIEMSVGWVSHSLGLVADSLDMLADAIVYGLSLGAVGAAMARKKTVAAVSGYFQAGLAILGFIEVLRRFFSVTQLPLFQWMVLISILALVANLLSLLLLRRIKNEEAHIQASWIFTSNDIIVNLGVILAGIGVYFSGSKWPDLIMGALVFSFVLRGAMRIIKLSK